MNEYKSSLDLAKKCLGDPIKYDDIGIDIFFWDPLKDVEKECQIVKDTLIQNHPRSSREGRVRWLQSHIYFMRWLNEKSSGIYLLTEDVKNNELQAVTAMSQVCWRIRRGLIDPSRFNCLTYFCGLHAGPFRASDLLKGLIHELLPLHWHHHEFARIMNSNPNRRVNPIRGTDDVEFLGGMLFWLFSTLQPNREYVILIDQILFLDNDEHRDEARKVLQIFEAITCLYRPGPPAKVILTTSVEPGTLLRERNFISTALPAGDESFIVNYSYDMFEFQQRGYSALVFPPREGI